MLDVLLVLEDEHLVKKAVEALGIDNINDIASMSPHDICTLHCEDPKNQVKLIPPHAIGIFLTLCHLTHFYASNSETLDWNNITREGF